MRLRGEGGFGQRNAVVEVFEPPDVVTLDAFGVQAVEEVLFQFAMHKRCCFFKEVCYIPLIEIEYWAWGEHVMMNVSNRNVQEQSDIPPLKWRILCIDDEPDILTVLRTTLSLRHDVVTALSGIEALKIFGLCEPDFVICDIRMPGLDGFATVEAIRQIDAYTDIPVFFLTAETSRDAARHGFAVGCNLYLTKPFDPVRLLDNIDYFTRESGHTVRPKSHTLADLADAIEAARRSPSPAPRPRPQRTAPEAAVRPAVAAAAPEARARTNADIKAERDALLADRKAREREFWKKRYTEIQAFIDQHMR